MSNSNSLKVKFIASTDKEAFEQDLSDFLADDPAIEKISLSDRSGRFLALIIYRHKQIKK